MAASGGAIVIVEQLGFFTSAPDQSRSSRWRSSSPRWSAFTSGITSGTSSSARPFEEFEETT